MNLQKDTYKRRGLTLDEVEASRREHGKNQLSVIRQKSFIQHYFANLKDPVIRILLCALVINLFLVFRGGDVAETIGIGISVFLATFISTFSEYRSESAFRRLSEECENTPYRVFRNGALCRVAMEEIVVGDLLLLSAGEKIPADGMLISGSLRVDQSAMTGESREISKHAGTHQKMTPDSPTAVFRGCPILAGEAEVLVCAVGDRTHLGQISREIQEQTRESPLKLRLGKLARQISAIGYGAAILVALAHLFHCFYLDSGGNPALMLMKCRDLPYLFHTVLHAFMLGLTILIVAVPEGLPLMIAVVLSSNIKKMVRDKVLVRTPVGIEAAGSMNLLFCDKTGTLTEGTLSVGGILLADGSFFSDADTLLRQCPALKLPYLRSCYQNSSSRISGDAVLGGNATDRAMLESVKHLSLPPKAPLLSHLPFDSARKYAAVTLSDPLPTYLKGAPERLLPHATLCYAKDGSLLPFAPYRAAFENRLLQYEKAGGRMLLLATSLAKKADAPLYGLQILGAILLRDRLRHEASPSVKKLQEAGIRVIMITGDNRHTAQSIATDCGIFSAPDDRILDSEELSRLSDDKVRALLPHLSVLARALPTDKSRLVRLAQEEGMVVGMTGDGINDAPALKRADIGFAMGSGTQVAKDAGDIIILDNNLSSITKAVLYGRNIFKSIRKFITLQLTMNFSAVAVSMVCPFFGIAAPVTVVQMLWINLIMDTLGGLAFANEGAHPSIMKEKPKRRDEPILNGYMIGQILFSSAFTLLLSLLFLFHPYFTSHFRPATDRIYLLTAFFAFFIFSSVLHCFNCRTDRLRLLVGIGQNRPFLVIMLSVSILQILFVYLGGAVLRTEPLTASELLFTLLPALCVLPADFLRKLLLRLRGKHDGF